MWPLQAPHEVLGALASLGCFAPMSASHGPGCVARLVAACRRKLLDTSNGGAAPVATAWALAVMQVGTCADTHVKLDMPC